MGHNERRDERINAKEYPRWRKLSTDATLDCEQGPRDKAQRIGTPENRLS